VAAAVALPAVLVAPVVVIALAALTLPQIRDRLGLDRRGVTPASTPEAGRGRSVARPWAGR
jgi:hypothetical protein